MIALIDLDSILFQGIYKCISIQEIREKLQLYSKEDLKTWLLDQVYNRGIERVENTLLQYFNHIENVFFEEITDYELFVTTCKNNFRYKIYPLYKKSKSRKSVNKNQIKYMKMLAEYYSFNGAFHSDTLEADDLIIDRKKELGVDNCIVIAKDKDFRGYEGYLWSYQRIAKRDKKGVYLIDENGNKITEYKNPNIEYISKKEAVKFFWKQMLVGDSIDNIKGAKTLKKEERNLIDKNYNIKKPSFCAIGDKNADKLLNNSNNYFITVAREYIKRGQKQDFKINHRLLKLGR